MDHTEKSDKNFSISPDLLTEHADKSSLVSELENIWSEIEAKKSQLISQLNSLGIIVNF